MSAGKITLYKAKSAGEKKEKTTYLTKRGYVILKDEFPKEAIDEFKADLLVAPAVNPDYSGPPESFKIYLENKTKMYIPKFYGIQKFGQPKENKIPEPTPIGIEFSGSLRDSQKVPVDKAMEAFNK